MGDVFHFLKQARRDGAKTPAEVRSSLGIGPDSQAVVATKGRTMLQWIFDGPKQRRYVNFVHLPGNTSPRVVSDFFLPR